MKPEFNIHVISDNHLRHEAINKLCHRGFRNLAEMDKTQIQRWNQTVKPHDLVIHVGDYVWTQGESASIAEIIKSMNGRKVLIRGNHDRKSYAWYLANGIDFICEKCTWDYNGKSILFIHNPNKVTAEELKNHKYIIHGHQHNSTPFLTKKNKTTIINVSVEHLKYTPISLTTLLHRLGQGYYEKSQ